MATQRREFKVQSLLICVVAMAVGACQKAPAPSPDQPPSAAVSNLPAAAAPIPPPSTAEQPAPPVTAPAQMATSRPAPPVAAEPAPVKPTTIPAGTRLTVRLESSLGSATSEVGEAFAATLMNGVTLQGTPLIPRRATVVGKVVDAKAAGKFAGAASLGLRLESVADHAVVTSTYTRRVEGKGHRTAAVIGGTAVAGALLGALAGHGRGAAIGALAGGGVGTLGAAETGNNRDIVLPEGTVLTFKLRQAISLEPMQ